ncbi:MAG: hypothetical protein ACRCSN_13225 [Dermatophilaceae bacterium]
MLIAPFVAVGVLRSPDRRWALRLLCPAGALYALYTIAHRTNLPVLDEAGWNFDGKLFAVAVLLFLIRGMTFARPPT